MFPIALNTCFITAALILASDWAGNMRAWTILLFALLAITFAEEGKKENKSHF